MSQSDRLKIENKTIRIPATAYYKAVEITGLLSAIAGHNYSLSEIIVGMISDAHTMWYPELLSSIQDEKKMAALRNALQKNIKFTEGLPDSFKIRK